MTLRALPGAVEERPAGLGISRQDVLNIEGGRTAQRLEDSLMDEVRELDGLLGGEGGAGLAALCWVPRLEERSEEVAVAVAGHHWRTNDRRTVAIVPAAALGAVTVDALGRPHGPATIRRVVVDLVLIRGAEAELGGQAERSGQEPNSHPQTSTRCSIHGFSFLEY